MDKFVKIVYFDESYATDYCQLAVGGILTERRENTTETEKQAHGNAEGELSINSEKGGLATLIKLVSGLTANMKASGETEASAKTDKIAKKIIENTVLSTFVDVLSKEGNASAGIHIFKGVNVHPEPNSFTYIMLIAPFMSMVNGQLPIAYQYIFGGEHNQNSMARDLIRRTSNVILLDEFDKVHPQFYNAFYQMFDEGKYVDSSYEVDVSKCVFICTSNFQSRTEAEKQLGKPILSRFSEVVIFEPLSAESKMRIVDNALETYISQLSKADRKIMEEKNGTKSIRAEFENVIKRGGGYGNIRMLKNDIENAINYKMLEWKGIL